MKIKASELDGVALDWAVAKCEGMDKYFDPEDGCAFDDEGCAYEPSCNWAKGGPIIEREKIEIFIRDEVWFAYSSFSKPEDFNGDTPLIAAMRCYVAGILGDEIEVPDCLIEVNHE